MTKLAGTIQKRFDRACKEFHCLEGVDTDHTRINTVSDMVYIALVEIDIHEVGEGILTTADVNKIRKFVKKWS